MISHTFHNLHFITILSVYFSNLFLEHDLKQNKTMKLLYSVLRSKQVKQH